MRRSLVWVARIVAIILLHIYCWYELGYSPQLENIAIPIVILLHLLVLYTFLICEIKTMKPQILRQVLIFMYVMLCRTEEFLQGFEYGTPWSQVLTVALRDMPQILLLHLAVQIAFSVVFYRMERRKLKKA